MPDSLSRIATDVRYSVVQFGRSRQSLFFTLVFPGLLMLVLGYMVGTPTQGVVLPDDQANSEGIGFMFPGILGMCIMFTAINETMSVLVRYRTSGLTQRLSVTPLSTAEWNVAKIVYGTLIMLLSVAVSFAVAWLTFGVNPGISLLTISLVSVGSMTFVGLGMIISGFVSDVKSVNAVAFSITLPLMLLSGSLFPVDRLPLVLQFASIFSPLTCLNNGLRSAMITGDTGTALGNLFAGVFLALVLFCTGVAVRMKDDGQDM
ncbi:ABC transporter permease [Methanocella sp. MCL-LM]|uniref:ABC transporter permease n=1 Tax=Methanocella sp. MCL-LM TaxID=3412035 RepID=UPI003C71F2FA